MELDKFGIVGNEFQLFYGEVVNLFYESRLGLYPRYLPDGKSVFGGLPQNTNLSSHLEWVKTDIEWYIANKTYAGLAVIDWESWRPLFVRNWKDKTIYRTLSMEAVEKEHPMWTRQMILRKAIDEFESKARTFMESTLALCKELRPLAKWGFYLFPDCYNYEPGQRVCSEAVTLQNDRLSWLFNTSGALYPSIYLPDTYKGNDQKLHVEGILREVYRMRTKFTSPHVSVIPYTRYMYANTNLFYSKSSLENSIGQAADSGAAGVVIWGSTPNIQNEHDCKRLHKYFNNVLGPYVENLLKWSERCSANHCSGHGRCIALGYADQNETRAHTIRFEKGPTIRLVRPAAKSGTLNIGKGPIIRHDIPPTTPDTIRIGKDPSIRPTKPLTKPGNVKIGKSPSIHPLKPPIKPDNVKIGKGPSFRPIKPPRKPDNVEIGKGPSIGPVKSPTKHGTIHIGKGPSNRHSKAERKPDTISMNKDPSVRPVRPDSPDNIKTDGDRFIRPVLPPTKPDDVNLKTVISINTDRLLTKDDRTGNGQSIHTEQSFPRPDTIRSEDRSFIRPGTPLDRVHSTLPITELNVSAAREKPSIRTVTMLISVTKQNKTLSNTTFLKEIWFKNRSTLSKQNKTLSDKTIIKEMLINKTTVTKQNKTRSNKTGIEDVLLTNKAALTKQNNTMSNENLLQDVMLTNKSAMITFEPTAPSNSTRKSQTSRAENCTVKIPLQEVDDMKSLDSSNDTQENVRSGLYVSVTNINSSISSIEGSRIEPVSEDVSVPSVHKKWDTGIYNTDAMVTNAEITEERINVGIHSRNTSFGSLEKAYSKTSRVDHASTVVENQAKKADNGVIATEVAFDEGNGTIEHYDNHTIQQHDKYTVGSRDEDNINTIRPRNKDTVGQHSNGTAGLGDTDTVGPRDNDTLDLSADIGSRDNETERPRDNVRATDNETMNPRDDMEPHDTADIEEPRDNMGDHDNDIMGPRDNDDIDGVHDDVGLRDDDTVSHRDNVRLLDMATGTITDTPKRESNLMMTNKYNHPNKATNSKTTIVDGHGKSKNGIKQSTMSVNGISEGSRTLTMKLELKTTENPLTSNEDSNPFSEPKDKVQYTTKRTTYLVPVLIPNRGTTKQIINSIKPSVERNGPKTSVVKNENGGNNALGEITFYKIFDGGTDKGPSGVKYGSNNNINHSPTASTVGPHNHTINVVNMMFMNVFHILHNVTRLILPYVSNRKRNRRNTVIGIHPAIAGKTIEGRNHRETNSGSSPNTKGDLKYSETFRSHQSGDTPDSNTKEGSHHSDNPNILEEKVSIVSVKYFIAGKRRTSFISDIRAIDDQITRSRGNSRESKTSESDMNENQYRSRNPVEGSNIGKGMSWSDAGKNNGRKDTQLSNLDISRTKSKNVKGFRNLHSHSNESKSIYQTSVNSHSRISTDNTQDIQKQKDEKSSRMLNDQSSGFPKESVQNRHNLGKDFETGNHHRLVEFEEEPEEEIPIRHYDNYVCRCYPGWTGEFCDKRT